MKGVLRSVLLGAAAVLSAFALVNVLAFLGFAVGIARGGGLAGQMVVILALWLVALTFAATTETEHGHRTG